MASSSSVKGSADALTPVSKRARGSAEEESDKQQPCGTPAAPSSTVSPSETPRAPRVVRLRSCKGVVVQDCDVYIGRRCTMGGWRLTDSKWHNPFSIKDSGTAERAVARFRAYLLAKPELLADLPELGGKVLGCWCKPAACHGDALRELYLERVLQSKSKDEGEEAV